ncbi:sensor histidine kinase [Alteribacillus sp. JSM 102045]|uniref:sensor histidine kinase n=1 Tax=Alteribacillus sp. JSM 102045 TaxID=1562101 RepID=UPI0035BEED82
MSSKKVFMSSVSLISRLTLGNMLVVIMLLGVSGFMVYQFACQLVSDINGVNSTQQQAFNEALLQYVLLILVISALSGSIFYFYYVKKVINPIRKLAESTEELLKGEFPQTIQSKDNNEISRLTNHFNSLSNKLQHIEESRERFVADMAHELRTPLSNINGYLEGLKKGIIKGDADLYHALHNESVRLIHMVDELYKLSEWEIELSGQEIQREKINIKEFIKQAVTLFQWEFEEKGIKVKVEIEEKELFIDPEEMQKVILNLIQNAIEHRHHQSPIFIEGTVKDSNYIINIAVEGKPIPSEAQSKIFERHYQMEDSNHSTRRKKGIGLAIVKEVVKKHGGEAGLTSSGSLHHFWCTLPFD